MTEKYSDRFASDAVKTGMKIAETLAKKAWSVIDAASEKKSPTEVLGQKGVKSVQGFKPE